MPNGSDNENDEEFDEGSAAEELQDQKRSTLEQGKEALKEKGEQMAKEAVKKAFVEPAKKAIVEGVKQAAAWLWTSVIVPILTFLAGTIEIWGPIALGVILVIIIVIIAASLGDSFKACVSNCLTLQIAECVKTCREIWP